MKSDEDIRAALLLPDGSCRDINFAEALNREGVLQLFVLIGREWALVAASDEQGEPVFHGDIEALLGQSRGALHSRWSGDSMLRHLQIYVSWTRPADMFCELTFFTEDVVTDGFTVDGFRSRIRAMAAAAGSPEYYVRYENAAWRHGSADCPDVILSHLTEAS